MKNTKRIVSFLLSAIMVVTTFLAVGPVFTIEAEAADDITIGGITQTHVVDNYESIYKEYQARFFSETGSDNWPTDMVIPGLSSNNDYTPQGMTYWHAKEWILISAYDASGEGKNSVIYAIDIKSGKFVALFNIYNSNGTKNTSHGGGIAASEYNFYYADKNSDISYWPLAEMDVAEGKAYDIKIYDTIDCSGELNGAATSYCCYDEGVLWAGNFYISSDDRYNKPANGSYESMIMGYKLVGSNSADEWAYLKGAYSKPIKLTATSGTGSANDANLNWKATQKSGIVTVTGSITAPTSYVGEFCPSFASFELTEGNSYILEFTTNTDKGLSDLYIFAPNGKGHTNVKQSSQTTVTELADGTYRYRMEFVAGLKPTGADSAWPATQSTDGSFTGTYTMRFDQDAIQVGEARDFTMSNIRISETPINLLKYKSVSNKFDNSNCSGTYSFTENTKNNTLTVSGTVTNSGTATAANTYTNSSDIVAPLVEGESYTLEFTSTSNKNYVYVWAPNGLFSTLSDVRKVESIGNGKYKYSFTFTAGKSPAQRDSGELNWPKIQSIDGTYTGLHRFRFDLNTIPVGSTYFEITDIKLRKTDSTYLDVRSIQAGEAGDPTYCIAVDETIDRIQYAMVDKGKLYISRSWSRTESANHIRELDIAEIDINSPGTKDLTINGQSRKCHFIESTASTFSRFGGKASEASRSKMLYMGEALCVIDDYLYMFGESAAWTYNGKEDSKCSEPIDVIWKIDQYAINNNARTVTEDIKASHYVKVNNMSELTSGDEYLIVFESSVKDRIKQKNILYALDSYGGYGDRKLPKKDSANKDLTGDSMGVVGYKIVSYSTEGNNLYIDETVDERKSIRWMVTHNGSGGQLKLANMDHFYSQNPYLNFDFRTFTMSTGTSSEVNGGYLTVASGPEGKFYISSTLSNSKGSYLWCNDGSDINPNGLQIYTDYYKSQNPSYTPVYAGVTEVAGTFHSDGMYYYGSGGGNVMGGAVQDYSLGQFSFYKRVPDSHTYTAETQVYTDFNAEVQSDGTYNLTLDTYATASLQYRKLASARPTDYVLVLDTSSSMSTTDCTGYRRHESFDLEAAAGTEDAGKVTSEGDTATYTGKMWIQHTDGVMCSVSVQVIGAGQGSYDWANVTNKQKQKLYLWYTHPTTGVQYWFYPENDDMQGTWKTTKPSSPVIQLEGIKTGTGIYEADRLHNRNVFRGICYEYRSDSSRIDNLKTIANAFAAKVFAQNSNNRVAVVRYADNVYSGANSYTGMIKPSGFVSVSGGFQSGDYTNAFFSSSQVSTLRSSIDNISAGTNTYTDYGVDMAAGILKNSGSNYLYGGDRSACVIVITDGAPGIDGDISNQMATTTAVANTTVEAAHKVKKLGAYVYTVRVGSTEYSGFNTTAFLSYTSSEHIDAEGMKADEIGSKNTQKADYTIEVATSGFNCNVFTDTLIKEVNDNALNALAKLDANAIIREKLNLNAFDLSQSTIQVGTQKAKYDGAMRLSFEDEITLLEEGGENADGTLQKDYVFNRTTGEFKVTNYDYSSNYVATHTVEAGTANKLTIKISNVWPSKSEINTGDINSDYVNVLANIEEPTGVYARQSDMTPTGGDKHKGFPVARVVVPQYTYVLDYGIGMLDVDIDGTLISVDTEFQKQSSYSLAKSSAGTSLSFENLQQDMTYTINKDATGMQRYFVLIQRPNGEYDWFAINIVPATNVYFEQDIFAVSNKAQATWSSEGSVNFDRQSISLWDDVYGFDENYLADNSNYSQGAAIKTTVTSTNNRSDTMKTTFNGNGADIYSVCGPTTGIQVIAFRDTTQPKQSNGLYPIAKSYVVDTFYNDTNYPGPLYQVPIVRFEGDYKKYEVEITSAYLSIAGALQSQSVESAVIDENGTISYTSDFTNDKESVILEQLGFEELIGTDVEFVWYSEDSVLNGGSGAQGADEGAFTTQALNYIPLDSYIDGIRVYHPGGDNMDTYYKDSEKGAKYYNVFDNMRAGTFSGSGISYIYGTQGGQELKFAEELESFFKGRPKNEVYLEHSGENAITFTVDNLDENSRVMVSLRTAQGSPKAVVNTRQFKDGTLSKMEMYYDITDYIGEIVDGKATVTIRNVGNGLLAVDNIKITGAGGIAAQSVLSDVFEIFSLDIVEVDPTKPINIQSSDKVEIPLPPVADEPEDNEPDDGNDDIVPPSDDNNPEEPAEDGFFAKVESFFVKIFNFFKNIFNKVSTFLKF